MVANLRETTRANQEQDWLKTNLARIAGLMQGHRDLLEVARLILRRADAAGRAQYGAFYLARRAARPTSRQQEFSRIADLRLRAGAARSGSRWARGWSARRPWSASRS